MNDKTKAFKYWQAEKEKRPGQLLVGIITDDFEHKTLWWKDDLNTLVDHLNACLRCEQLLTFDYEHTTILQTTDNIISDMFWEQTDITLWWGSGPQTEKFEMLVRNTKNNQNPFISLLDATNPETFAEDNWSYYEWDEQGRPSGMNRKDTRIPPKQQNHL